MKCVKVFYYVYRKIGEKKKHQNHKNRLLSVSA